jgi:outer membrane protein insertion porin family
LRPHRRAPTRAALVGIGLAALLIAAAAPIRAEAPPAAESARVPAEGAAGDAAPGVGGATRVAVLPFRVHSARPLGVLTQSIGDLLATRLAATGVVEVIDAAEVRAALGGVDPTQEELLDAQLRRLGQELGADAVIAGSLTELAGRFSLDVRVAPTPSERRSRTIVFTANSEEELLDRIAEVADRAAATLAGAGSGPVLGVELVGAGDLEQELRARIQSRPGEPYDPDRARADRDRLIAHPGVASASFETDRSPEGVVLRFRVVRSEMIFGGGPLPGAGQRVAEIRVEGNRRIDADAIRSRIRTKVGEELRPAQVAADVREIFGLGFFRNVRVLAEDGPEGRILTFQVEENPVVRQIAIVGNENIDSDKVRDTLTLTTGSTLDYPLLYENTQRIEALYRAEGYYLAKVSYVIDPLAEGSVSIDFQVDEGEKLHLKEIDFVGNHAFSDDELRDDFATKRWRFWSLATSWFDKSGTYSEPIFVQDLRRVEKKYTDDGYLQVEVGEPVVEAKEDGLYITVAIEEGPQFRVGHIGISGDETIDLKALRKDLKLEEGEVFNRSHLTSDVERIERHYTDRGFYFASIQPATQLSQAERAVDVDFHVQKGPLYFIRKVEIAGNTRTVDPVVRREMRVVEGQLYSARAIQLSNARVRRLGYFEDVSFEPKPTPDPSQLDLAVNVVERPTGAFSFGAGYSSQDAFVFTASLSQDNLFGRGYSTSISADIGGRTSRFYLSFNDPYFLGSEWSLGASVFRTELRYEDFQQQNTGVDLSLGHALREDNTARGFVRYSFSDRNISQDSFVNASAVIFRELLQGSEATSLVGLSFNSDTRNDRFAPTSGTNYGASLEYAGLGGFAKFLRFEGRFAWYLGAPSWLLDRSTFVVATRFGYAYPFNTIDDFDLQLEDFPGCKTPEFPCENVAQLDQIDRDIKLPLSERYFLGGLGTFQLRGYRARSVGPRRPVLQRGPGITGQLFHPVGTELVEPPVAGGPLVAVCNDRFDAALGNPNQGNGNGRCNDLGDKEIKDFEDLKETDVIGGNSFISSTVEYRFPISEEIGLQGVFFGDGGNAFAEGDELRLFDPTEWRYGVGGGVLWFSPFGPLQLVLGFPINPLSVEDSPVFEFSVGGFGL